jgi:hypothetical protein
MIDHPAVRNLRTNQRQLDMDGCEVGVSRQAIEEAIVAFDRLITALTEICFIRAPDTPEGAWRSDLQQIARTALERTQEGEH